MDNRLLLGTTNPAKINILRAALRTLPFTAVTLEDLNLHLELLEPGKSTRENAVYKAKMYMTESGLATVAVDGALFVERFADDEQPGIRVRRIHGRDRAASDQELVDYYAGELERIGGSSPGLWQGSIALALSAGEIAAENYWFRVLLTSQRSSKINPGAPLDSLSIDPASGKRYAELDFAERPDTLWIREFIQRQCRFRPWTQS